MIQRAITAVGKVSVCVCVWVGGCVGVGGWVCVGGCGVCVCVCVREIERERAFSQANKHILIM